jgi:glucose/arabinose dehydrogenase
MRIASVLAVLATVTASAASLPPGFVDNLLFTANAPTGLEYEPGSGNLFVLEKGDGLGGARVLRRAPAGGTVTTALTMTCVDDAGERGLLGIAFDPDYLQDASTRWVYLYYTRLSPSSGPCSIPGSPGPRNRVVRFKEAGGVLSGEEVLLEGPDVSAASNHNGGTLRFAPDKTLFVSMGDNSTDHLPTPGSRDLSDLRGKILRINRDGTAPADNPFVGQAGVRPEIWAWGLRNPFRFSIDPANGTPWIGDVGQNTYEEIDHGMAGADYGWPCLEANAPFRTCNPAPANPIAPALVYGHEIGIAPFRGATVIGGPVYRGGNFPSFYQGRLFFGDYTFFGWIRTAAIGPGGTLSDVQLFMDLPGAPVDFVQGPGGCLGWVDVVTGGVHEICFVDLDGDGFGPETGDCDDANPAIHPGAPEVCNGLDDNCDGIADEDPQGVDSDQDAIANACDNCVLGFNPQQSDLDHDGEGDICDLNDGLIYVSSSDKSHREWQAESGYTTWNSYRGSLLVLRTTGVYTQATGTNPLAARDCGLTDPFVFDDVVPGPGRVAFNLVAGVAGGVESGLGTNSAGVPRANTNPCP